MFTLWRFCSSEIKFCSGKCSFQLPYGSVEHAVYTTTDIVCHMATVLVIIATVISQSSFSVLSNYCVSVVQLSVINTLYRRSCTLYTV